MELALDMLDKYDNETIARLTGIKESTIKDWRMFIMELGTADISLKPNFSEEKILQSRFVKTLNVEYQEYVKTKYGIIDVLTTNAVYELKVKITNSTIQKPVGQVILYSSEMHDRKKIIVAKSIKLSSYIRNAVNSLGIELFEFQGTHPILI